VKKLAPIIGLAALCYANALGGSFHFDDSHAVQDNPSIRSLANIPRFFSDAGTFSVLPQNQGYRPLLLVTYALTAAVTGVDAHAFVAVNLLVHILCALMVFLTVREVLRHLGREANAETVALISALIFASHPIFSECVSYVSARSESLSGLLMLASLYAYLRARAEPRWIAVAMLAIAGALLTKPTVTIFPLILLVFEAAAAERQPARRWLPRFFAVTAVVIVLGLLGAHMTPALAIRSASHMTRAQYFRSELPAIWHYARLFVLPVGQSADPDYPIADSFFEPRVLAAAVGLVAIIGFSAWSIARRRYTGIGLAIAWFLLCLFPASSIFPLAEVVNEHRPYLAAVSLCVLLAAAIAGGTARRQQVTYPLVAVLLVVLGTATVLRNRVWRTEESLWADVLKKSPGSTRAQMGYGMALMNQGRLDEAEPYLREAVRLAPLYAYARINLGNLFMAKDLHPEALRNLDRAIRLAPDLVWARYYRGLAAERIGESPGTRIAYFGPATELSPNFAEAWYHLSLARDAAGDVRGALEAARRATDLDASFANRFMLAYLLLKTNDAAAARPLLDRLHAERPDDAKVNYDLEYLKKLK
jgi:tetratricopeptide (TPR) repeat protein